MSKRYLTIPEVAERTRMTVPALYMLRHKGGGPPGFKLGRRVLFAEEDVDAWLEQHRADALAQRDAAIGA